MTTKHSIIDDAQNRYTTKVYDKSKTISDADMDKVRALLRLSPSSVNLQPWHFVIAGTDAGKQRVAKSTDEKYPFNSPSIKNASHAIVFCSRLGADEAYQMHILSKEDADGRFIGDDIDAQKAQRHSVRQLFVDLNRGDDASLQHWMQKQVYLNMGSFLLGVAVMGIDATPMEGIDTAILNEEFGLTDKGFEALAVVTIGYRDSDNDYNEGLPKSRLSLDDITTEI